MKIYRCDKCGFEKTLPQIVGKEFEYAGFKTLERAYQFNGVVDVCEGCFKDILTAKALADKAGAEVQRKTLLQRLGVMP